MTFINLEKCRLLMVEADERLYYEITRDSLYGNGFWQMTLPSGNWSILGFTEEIDEDQAKDIVKKLHNNYYYDYEEPCGYWIDTALESFASLLQANSITTRKLVLIERL